VKILIDIPDELINDMKDVEKFYGFSTNELTVSALRRCVDNRRRLMAQALKH
jgi:hypothetical protein